MTAPLEAVEQARALHRADDCSPPHCAECSGPHGADECPFPCPTRAVLDAVTPEAALVMVETPDQLAKLDPRLVLIASGRYLNGQGTFHRCHVRRLPEFITGSDAPLFEVLTYGEAGPHTLASLGDIDLPAILLTPSTPERTEREWEAAVERAARALWIIQNPINPEKARAEWDGRYLHRALRGHAMRQALAAIAAYEGRDVSQ